MNLSDSARIEHVYVSVAHNYFGHAGREPSTHPAIEQTEAAFVAGAGIQGDRFFRDAGNHKGQVTFFAMEVFEALRAAVGTPDCLPSAVRRNVFTRGLDLDALIGRRFTLQGVGFEGVEECRPCYWMDRAVGVGAEAFLQGRGGLRARILQGGVLRAGEAADLRLEPASSALPEPSLPFPATGAAGSAT
jgi:MOSC domain-containing protein YiiM